MVDDGDSWGKTTAWSGILSRHEELGNGSKSWWLAGGKCGGSLPRGGGKSYGREWPPAPFIGGGERERAQ
jgi:hypothetical protein